jgi:tRNA A-37 threonylcarbamoyl transferase component Bud32
MTSIDSLLSQNKNLQDSQLIKTFKSKKNTVCLLKKNRNFFVLKWFQQRTKKNYSQENYILSQKKTSFTKPDLIENDDENQFLILQYIQGENICDIINDSQIQTNQKIIIIQKLANWFYQFHSYFQTLQKTIIHGDAHLRNFILNKNQIVYGFDFEETQKEEYIKDISNLCASILTTTPEFNEEKKQLVRIFVEAYENLNKKKFQDINSTIEESVEKIMKRRKKIK